MRKIKLILFITIFALFLGINNVEAKKYQLGVCDYGDRTVTVYSDRTVKVSEKAFEAKFNVSETAIKQMYDTGECYKYMYLDKAGKNTATFSNDATGYNGDKYELSLTSKINCYYDLLYYEENESVDHYYYIRLHLGIKENGSRIIASTMTGNNIYTTIPFDLENSVTAYKATRNSGVITYNLSKPETAKLIFGTQWELPEVMVPKLYESLKSNTCPTISYYSTDDNLLVASEQPDNNLVTWSTASSNSNYKTTNDAGTTTDNTDADASDTSVDYECIKNSKVPVLAAYSGGKPVYDGNATINFKLIRDNGVMKYCVESDIGYSCSGNNANSYLDRLTLKNTRIQTSNVHFSLDKDVREFIEANKDKTTIECPSFIGAYYLNGGSIDDSNYIITLDSSKATYAFDEGEVDNPHTGESTLPGTTPGQAEYTCEGLIGENVLSFLTLIFRLIRIIGPIIALVLGMYDIFMAMVNGEEDAKKKAFKKLRGRIIAAVLLLVLPYILDVLLNLVNKTGSNCIPH